MPRVGDVLDWRSIFGERCMRVLGVGLAVTAVMLAAASAKSGSDRRQVASVPVAALPPNAPPLRVALKPLVYRQLPRAEWLPPELARFGPNPVYFDISQLIASLSDTLTLLRGGSEVWEVTLPGATRKRKPHRLVSLPVYTSQMILSPDGKRWACLTGEGPRLWIGDKRGKGRLVSDSDAYFPRWTANGEVLFFHRESVANYHSELWYVYSTRPPYRLEDVRRAADVRVESPVQTPNLLNASLPNAAFSNDGTRIAVWKGGRYNSIGYSTNKATLEMRKIALAKTPITRVPLDLGDSVAARLEWSPDDHWIYLVINLVGTDARPRHYVVEVATGRIIYLNPVTDVLYPVLNPDDSPYPDSFEWENRSGSGELMSAGWAMLRGQASLLFQHEKYGSSIEGCGPDVSPTRTWFYFAPATATLSRVQGLPDSSMYPSQPPYSDARVGANGTTIAAKTRDSSAELYRLVPGTENAESVQAKRK